MEKSKNSNLHAAKSAKNDEFYTQYSDIAEELKHYKEHFKGKVVYCNCDDPEWSNFWKYFHNNFRSLGLKKLIATHYAPGYDVSYAKIYEGGDDFNMDAGKTVDIYGNDGFAPGDFRSNDSIQFLEECDICCTNPPFSLFRPFISQLMEYENQFIIIGNMNAITYKEVFPLLKDNKVWAGYGFNLSMVYKSPYPNLLEANQKYVRSKGYDPEQGYVKVPAICWFTNLDINKRHDGLWHLNGKFDETKSHRYYEGFENDYPKFDNYDAINVNKVSDIPIDYPGVIGVPITFLDKYNPDEFKIIKFRKGNDDKDLCINGKCPYFRVLIQNKQPISKADDKKGERNGS